jgi:hypothetical protein
MCFDSTYSVTGLFILCLIVNIDRLLFLLYKSELFFLVLKMSFTQTREKKPRESLLCAEFDKAICYINKGLPDGRRLKFLHMDLSKLSRR